MLKKSGSRNPRIELEEIGPSIDFKLRRVKLASEDLFKLACRKPKELKVIYFVFINLQYYWNQSFQHVHIFYEIYRQRK